MISPTGIWSGEEAKPENYPHSELLCYKLIFHAFDKGLMIWDMGCGDGFYMYKLFECGFNVIGIEGHHDNSKPLIVRADLSEPLSSSKLGSFYHRQGQVLCLEVGEHIPEQFEQTFINNLCLQCDSRMVLSWAVPGQGGLGHVNERPNQYIVGQLEKRGLSWNKELTSYLRADIEQGVSYFKNTLMVFDKCN